MGEDLHLVAQCLARPRPERRRRGKVSGIALMLRISPVADESNTRKQDLPPVPKFLHRANPALRVKRPFTQCHSVDWRTLSTLSEYRAWPEYVFTTAVPQRS